MKRWLSKPLLAVIFELIDDTSVLIITAYKIGREE